MSDTINWYGIHNRLLTPGYHNHHTFKEGGVKFTCLYLMNLNVPITCPRNHIWLKVPKRHKVYVLKIVRCPQLPNLTKDLKVGNQRHLRVYPSRTVHCWQYKWIWERALALYSDCSASIEPENEVCKNYSLLSQKKRWRKGICIWRTK